MNEILFVSVVFPVVMTMIMLVFYIITMQNKSKSKYDDIKKEVELSLMRSSYENKIAELTKEMIATPERWRDANSIILSGQEHQKFKNKNNLKEEDVTSNFLDEYGINIKNIEVIENKIFVLTPFSEKERNTFQVIKESCNDIGYIASRGDEKNVPGEILPHIIKNIVNSNIIIANITTRNPNVFFELGISMALSKKIILVSEVVNEEIPFDIQNRRVIFFSNYRALREKIKIAILHFK